MNEGRKKQEPRSIAFAVVVVIVMFSMTASVTLKIGGDKKIMTFDLLRRARKMWIRKSRKALGIFLAAILLTMVFVATAPSVAAVPVFDGYNTSDWDAEDFLISDPIDTNNSGVVPPQTWPGGYDISELWAHYDNANDTMYFRLDVYGCPGDTDGNCNDTTSGDPTNMSDSAGVGSGEEYSIWIDIENECKLPACPTGDWEYEIYYTNNGITCTQSASLAANTSAKHGNVGCSSGDNYCIVEFKITNASEFKLQTDGKCIPYTLMGRSDSEYDVSGEDFTSALQVSPEANFTATTECYCTDTQFNDTSIRGTAPLINWSWDFDEDSIPDSYVRNATYHFPAGGTYNVTLWVTDEKGCVANITKEVTVYANPEANFTFDNTCFCTNVTFNDTSMPGDAALANWTWELGDGTVLYTQNVSWHYATNGTYQVNLTVVDENGCSNTTSRTVTVWSNPIANFTALPVCFDFPTIFTDSSVNGSGVIVNWTWDFGDNTSLNYSQHPAHTYAAAGIYNVTLMIADANNCTNTTSKNVTVCESLTPIATFTYSPTSPLVNETVTFDASSSYDPDGGNITSYLWNVSGTYYNVSQFNHTFTTPGSKYVFLQVEDDEGDTNSTTRWLNVSTPQFFSADDYFPRIQNYELVYLWRNTLYRPSVITETCVFINTDTINCSWSDSLGSADGTFNIIKTSDYLQWADFGTCGSDPFPLPMYMFFYYAHMPYNFLANTFSIGDTWTGSGTFVGTENYTATTYVLGLEEISVLVGNFTSIKLKTEFNSSNDYLEGTRYIWLVENVGIVKLIYQHADGSVTDGELKEYEPVVNQSPIASFTFSPASPLVNESVTFDASSSYDPDGGIITSYLWNVSGTYYNTSQFNHTFTTPGSKNVALVVWDDEGETNETTRWINVTEYILPSTITETYEITSSLTRLSNN